MSDEIKPGDLVMVVKPMPCCGNTKTNGYMFHVQKIISDRGYCVHCNAKFEIQDHVHIGEGMHVLKFRLKKIPPLSELESQTSSLDNPIKEPHKEKV